MNKIKRICNLWLLAIILLFTSCASTHNSVISNGMNLADYKYAVLGTDSGDAELADILVMVENDLAQKINIVSEAKAFELASTGHKILRPMISVKSEKWDGGHTYISIIFRDYETNQSVAVIKSSGIGASISQDQKLAYQAIKKEIDKVFK